MEAAKGPRGILSLDSSLLKDRGGHGFSMVQLQDGGVGKNSGSLMTTWSTVPCSPSRYMSIGEKEVFIVLSHGDLEFNLFPKHNLAHSN